VIPAQPVSNADADLLVPTRSAATRIITPAAYALIAKQ
jgi:hypothetical protein